MSDAHAPAPHAPKHEDKTVTTVSNVLAIVGFAILIVIVVWGLLHIATLSSGWFTNLFPTGNKTSTITVTAPSTALSGEPVRVTWRYATSDAGRYAFLYECADGVEYGVPVLREGDTRPSLARVPCGAAFTLGNATSSIVVVPILATSTARTSHMTVLFVPSTSGKEVQGSATMTVTPNSALPETTSTPTATSTKPTPIETKPAPTEKPVTEKPAPRPATPADLAVTIQSISTDSTGFTTATFDIRNIGGSTSDTYYFTASLPTSQPYTYVSQPQAPLAPGAHVVNTLRFSQTVSGIFSVTVSGDASASNNSASQQVYGGYYRGY